MAKQVIVLAQASNGITTTYQVAFWYPATTGIATQPNGSVWSGALTTENAAIQAGTVLEEVEEFTFPTGTGGANIEAYLLQHWTNRNAQIGGVGPHQYYGSYYDPAAGGWAIA